ncbi:uncharacterized protein LOC124128155 isoform X3 [Haliotis rufescens]|uniref:uncharacterized protein LOC124128155 isoform X3 n=1 Tax=Haliotis rufescens TaxID=6454 RepID=UPI00201EFC97|nr:uncharacterized protein LOC124128155 isoform X3 [Haliotis rufescens]
MSSSGTVETSVSSYNYHSEEGGIQCCTSKQYDVTSSSSDERIAAFKDTKHLQQSVIDDVERKQVEQIISKVFQGEVQMYPRYVATDLDRCYPNIYKRIMNAFASPSVFIFAAFTLMKHLDVGRFVRTPKHVIFDVCVFRTSKPIVILTFMSTTAKEESVLVYNSRLAKFAVRSINEDLHLDLSVIHGVLTEEDCNRDDVFSDKIEQLESKTSVFALPVSLHMDSDLHGKVVTSFLKRIEERRSSEHGSVDTELMDVDILQINKTDTDETGGDTVTESSLQNKVEELRRQVERLQAELKVERWKAVHNPVAAGSDRENSCHNCIYRVKYQNLLAKRKRRYQGGNTASGRLQNKNRQNWCTEMLALEI